MVKEFLYHCVPVTPEGDFLRASTGYGAELPINLRMAFNHFSTAKIPLLFAATKFSKALAFGFNCRSDQVLFNHSIESVICDKELIIVCNRQKTVDRDRDVTVFKLPRDEFLPFNDEQWVRRNPIPFSNCNSSYRAKNAVDLMRAGLQVFAFEESLDELKRSGMSDYIMNLPASQDYYKKLGELIRSKKLFWENRERNVGFDNALATAMEIDPVQKRRIKITSGYNKSL